MLDEHPAIKAYLEKVRNDNIRFLVAAVAWNILVSAIPLTIGMIALSKVVFGGDSREREIERQMSRAFQGVFQPHYLDRVVSLTVHHSGILIAISVVSALWGAWNVGFALSDTFNALFEVGSRSFWREKAIDLAMFVVLFGLMFGIVALTTTQGAITRTIDTSPLPNVLALVVKTVITTGSAFLLFAVLYMVYPNTTRRIKLDHVWQGALLAAILFECLSFIWPLYEQHFQKYGGFLFPLLVLVLWVYFFSFILVLGAEVVALIAIKSARDRDEALGPAPSKTVPEHRTLAQGRQSPS